MTLAWVWHSSYTRIIDDANRGKINSMTQVVKEGVLSLMAMGADQAEIDKYLASIDRINLIEDVRLVPSSILEKTLSAKTYHHVKDDFTEQVISSGQEQKAHILFGKDRSIRRGIPIVAEKSCLSCHTAVKEGDVLGALVMTVAYQDRLNAMNTSLKGTSIILFGITLLLLGGIFLFFKHLIMRPLTQMTSLLGKLEKGDLMVSVDIVSRDEMGQLGAAFNHFVTVLKEKRVVERSFKEQRSHLQGFIDQFPYPFYVVDVQDYRILMANSVMQVPAADIGRSSCHQVTHQSQQPCSGDHPCPMREVLNTKKPVIMEHIHRTKEGNSVFLEFHGIPLFDEDGKVVRMIEYFINIDERKKQEELQRKIREEAQEAARAKGKFLANMSHEMRTPMNAIIGFSDLLQNTVLDNVQRDYVDTIKNSGDVLLVLINDILDVSKIEAGALQLEKIGFDLEYLVGSVLKMVKTKVLDKNIDLLFEFLPGTPMFFMGDPTRIRQIILNLIGNAAKFTQRGEVKVTVSTVGVSSGVGDIQTIVISVKDTGIGIPQDKLGMIFDVFTQADESTTRKFGGTGLGLSISRSLAQKMGGDIEVRSEVGRGSEFIVTLQLELAEPVANKDISMVSMIDLTGKKVVIVDDNQSNVKLIERYCQESGLDVVFTAGRANKLLEWLNKQQDLPQIILADIMMPEKDGMDLAKQLRKEEKYKQVKLIAVTSDVRPGTAAQAQQVGFDAYLPKPVIRKELIKIIQVVLGDKRETKEIVTRHTAEELSLKDVKVLVVEDMVTNQKLLKVYLDMFGCRSDYANNGQEAVEKMKNGSYDVCLMDLQMPVMGGLEATEIIRREFNKDIPIIALTAAAMKEDEEKSLKGGMNDYLTKPIDRQKLKDLLIKWTKGQAEKRK
ncbi:MAG: response regulator [Candidatus Omnitrophica bacterium]|nr:response regulator [Candidatus Omnitrophota bacterium]